MNFKKIFIILLGTVLFVSSLSAQYVGKEFIFSGLVEYDESGNKIHEKGEESEVWLEYDENGNMTHSKVADIYDDWATREYWFTYDSEGKRIGERGADGEYSFEYDEQNHKIIEHGGNRGNWVYDCDEKWNKLHGSNGVIQWWAKYDSNGNQILHRDMEGFVITYEYDSKNHLTKKSEYNKYITNYEYDPNGNLFRESSNYTSDVWYAYTYWSNGKVKSQRRFRQK